MDFASLMNKQLSKAKTTNDSPKKYLKRSEIEEERTKAYLAEQKALEEDREAKAAAKRKREDDIAAENAAREEKRRRLAEESRKLREEKEEEEERARRKRLGLPELVKKEDDEEAIVEDDDIPEDEMRDKLRELGHPVALFGESHTAKLRRYRKLTTVMSGGPIPTTLKLVEEKDMKVDGTVPPEKDGRKWLFRQLASYFTMVLAEYERAMEEEKTDTSASKTAFSAMVQTRENLKPVSGQTNP
jgi:pre-mRNA-splicing factor 18